MMWGPTDSAGRACIPPGPGAAYYPCDLRGVPVDPHALVIYRLWLSSGLSFGVDRWVLSWPDSSYLRQRCDSLILIDISHGGTRIDMFLVDSIMELGADTLQPVFQIYKYGSVIVDAVADDGLSTPKGYSLMGNYPNPFNPASTIRYALPSQSSVTLKVYNALGQLVATLVDEVQTPGYKSVVFNGTNLPSGVYFYNLDAIATSSAQKKIFMDVKKMSLIR
jgi:hypothetical protein